MLISRHTQGKLKPITPTQQSIYFDQLRLPNNPCYNEGVVSEIKIAIDPDVFNSAIQSLVGVFDMLTVDFILQEGELFHDFNRFDSVPFTYVDCSKDVNAKVHAEQLIKERFETPYQLGKDRLINFCLYKLANNHFLFEIRFHHIVCDAVGVSLLLRALDPAYQSVLNSKPFTYTNTYPYVDEIEKEHEYIESKSFQKDRLFWNQKFEQLPSPLLARQQRVNPYRKSQRLTVELPQFVNEKLKVVASEFKVTYQQIGITALAIYFAKTRNLNEVVFGIPVHRRRKRVQKSIFATYTSDLPCVFSLTENASIKELLSSVNTELRTNYRYQSYPKASLSRDLGLLDKGMEQIAQVFFNFQDFTTFPFMHGHMDPLRLSSGFEQDPLHIRMCHYGDEQPIRINFDFREEYITPVQGRLLANTFVHILEELACADLNQNWQSLNIVSKEERALIDEFSVGKQVFDDQFNFITRFDKAIHDFPNNVAIIDNARKVTYGELEQLTHKYISELSRNSVVKGDRVILAIERNADLIAAIIAVFRIGACYVPLDVALPERRIHQIVASCGAKYAVSNDLKVKEIFKNHLSIEGREVETEFSELAYLIYTSGTTGVPKGVAIGHAQLSNFIEAMINEFSFTDDCNVLAHTPISFDIHLLECLVPLSIGGCVTLASNEQQRNPESLIGLIESNQVNFVQATPSMWRMLLDEGFKPQAKIKMLSGGEPLSDSLANELRTTSDIALWNIYGPTETTVWSTCKRVDKQSVNIGLPLLNTKCIIVDDQGKEVGIGTQGELLIGGSGVGLGYWHLPELTAQKFIQHTDKDGCVSRFYRTGDLVYWDVDANKKLSLVCKGRNDEQVKLRGYRLELVEIENTILQTDLVKDCCVNVSEGASHQQELIAYIVPNDDVPIEESLIDNIEEALASLLPHYMFPQSYIKVDKIPLNSNGKKDRNLLLLASKTQTMSQQQRSLTSTEVELLSLWRQLIEIEKSKTVNHNSSFFALGGNSVLLVKLKSLIKQYFNVDIETRELFELRELFALARKIEEKVQRSRILSMDKESLTEVEF